MQSRSVESVPQDVSFQTGSRVIAGSAPTAALTRAGASREASRASAGRGLWGQQGGRRVGAACAGPVPVRRVRCAGLPRACAPGEGVLASVSAPALVFQ